MGKSSLPDRKVLPLDNKERMGDVRVSKNVKRKKSKHVEEDDWNEWPAASSSSSQPVPVEFFSANQPVVETYEDYTASTTAVKTPEVKLNWSDQVKEWMAKKAEDDAKKAEEDAKKAKEIAEAPAP